MTQTPFSLNNPYAKTEDEENYDILKRVTERQNAAPNVDPKDVPDPYYQPPTEVTPISAEEQAQKQLGGNLVDSIREALGMKASPTEAKPEQEPEEAKPNIDDIAPEHQKFLDDPNVEFKDGKPFYKKGASSGFIYGGGNPNLGEDVAETAERIREGLSAPGMGLLDFGLDMIGKIPGLEGIDDAWDEKTKFKNKEFNTVRDISNIVLPNLLASGPIGALTKSIRNPVARGIARTGLSVGTDVGVAQFSDVSERDDNLLRVVDDMFPFINVPESLKTMDDDSPEVRREKNVRESAGLGILADVIGYTFRAGAGTMGWLIPNSQAARIYKETRKFDSADVGSAEAYSMAQGKLTEAERELKEALVKKADPTEAEDKVAQAMDEVMQLSLDLDQTGKTAGSGTDPLQGYVALKQEQRDWQIDDAAAAKLSASPGIAQEVDPDLMADVLPEASTSRLSIPPGAVVRNAGDTTAIKTGTAVGDPTPMISEPMMREALAPDGDSRQIVMELMDENKLAGDYDVVVNGARFTQKNMKDAAWDIASSIVQAKDVDELRQMFLAPKDINSLFKGKSFQIGVAEATMEADMIARGQAYALKYLTDKFIGTDVVEQSARVMDTTGREIASMSEAFEKFKDIADPEHLTDMIGDKMELLMTEYGINKYISGWSLQNKKWWKKLEKATPQEAEDLMSDMMTQFDSKLVERRDKARQLNQMIKTLREEDPLALRALVSAYDISNGDVDTIAKLNQWAQNQINPLNFFMNREGMNLFSKGLWAVLYNNTLSGLSAFRAGIGSTASLMAKASSSILGATPAALKGNPYELKKNVYALGALWETNRRSMDYAYKTWKKANLDPEALMDRARKDYIFEDDAKWEAMDQMAEVFERDGKGGQLALYRWSKFNHDLSLSPWMRYGTNAMVGIDAFTNANMATFMARYQAYDEVMEKFQKIDTDALDAAEKRLYESFFDKNGLIKDKAVNNASGEIALNLDIDNPVAEGLNKMFDRMPISKMVFMFPTTGFNDLNYATSFTPLANIPGMTKYGKILHAGDDLNKIKEALAMHDVVYDQTPNAMSIYKNLRNEYRGRQMLTAGLTIGTLQYALMGNITGNGPVNASDRQKWRDLYGWQAKSIKIGDAWVSYEGIPVLDPILTVIGDMAMYSRDMGSSFGDHLMQKIAHTLTATFTNKTLFSQLEPFHAIATGDERAMNRFIANAARTAYPLSGLQGVILKNMDSSAKDIENELGDMIANKLLYTREHLAKRRDIFTGKVVNDYENPFVAFVNKKTPFKVSATSEPWRRQLLESGWKGMGLMQKSSDGLYDYNPHERERLFEIIGRSGLDRDFEKILNTPKYQDQIGTIRAMRAQGADEEKIDAAYNRLEVYKVMDSVVRSKKKAAEEELRREHPHIADMADRQREAAKLAQRGRVLESIKAAPSKEEKLKNVLKFNNGSN